MWPSEADHIPTVVDDLESAKAVAGVFKRAVHGYGLRDVLRIQGVGIVSVDVCIPARPVMAGMIGLRMNLRCDGLEHDHYAVALHDAPKIFAVSISPALIGGSKAQLGAIKVEARLQIVYNKKRRDGI